MFDGGRAVLASPATRHAVVLLTEAVLYSAFPPVDRPGEAGAVRGVGEGGRGGGDAWCRRRQEDGQ